MIFDNQDENPIETWYSGFMAKAMPPMEIVQGMNEGIQKYGNAYLGANYVAQQQEQKQAKKLDPISDDIGDHVPYADIFRREAKRYGVPVKQLAGLAWAESTWGKKSSLAARGIMQVLPDTFKDIKRHWGAGNWSIDNPEHNIRAGANYLSDMYKATGDWQLAANAYTAGLAGSQDMDSKTKARVKTYWANWQDGIRRSRPKRQQEYGLKTTYIGNRKVTAREDFLEKLLMADKDKFAETGKHITISSDFRTHDKQKEIYKDHLAGKIKVAAKPGHSNHERGAAIDAPNKEDWAYLNKHGFRNDVPNDRLHFSFTGR